MDLKTAKETTYWLNNRVSIIHLYYVDNIIDRRSKVNMLSLWNAVLSTLKQKFKRKMVCRNRFLHLSGSGLYDVNFLPKLGVPR